MRAMAEAMDEIEGAERGETLGEHAKVLRTLVPSPAIRAICQANLRFPGSRDILLVKVARPCADRRALTAGPPSRAVQSRWHRLPAGILPPV